jgi:hypothetical protein
MAAERTPYHFRPMDELDHEETVEFSLRNGRVVHGRMLKGIITPDTVAAWQKDKAA